MKTMVISYSLTGNNEGLAESLAATLGAGHLRITEAKPRTMATIVLDMMLHRTPKIVMPAKTPAEYDLIVFVGPVWMGQIATPFRACFKQLSQGIGEYAFISICGGADGPNPKLGEELEKRLGKEPVCLLDLHIADLLPSEPEPTREDTMAYRITEREIKVLTTTTVASLHKAIAN